MQGANILLTLQGDVKLGECVDSAISYQDSGPLIALLIFNIFNIFLFFS